MNSGDRKSPPALRRCPSNVSDVSQISAYSISGQKPKALYSDYHLGDWVYVDSISGVKYGVIRFAGYVEFAKGYWFGIELSEPNGKNNGSIKGKQYFSCPENHGIFTQSSKISKSPPIKKTHRLSSGGSMFGSRESLSSIGYLKRNGLNTSQESLRSCVSGVSAITGVFKQTPASKALKNQLLRAKRAEGAESPSKSTADRMDSLSKELSILSVQESEQLIKSKIELANQKRELEEQCKQYADEVNELKIAVSEEKRLGKELVNQLEEEKKRMEMLEFNLQEEKITRMHLEEEVQKKEKLVDDLKRKSEDAANLKNDENEIELFELQEDLIKKEEKILQLESTLKSKQNENSNLTERIREFEATIKVFEQRQESQLTKIDDLNLRIKKNELERAQLEEQLSSSKQDQRQESGQLSAMTSELAAKNAEIDELKDQLTKKTNEVVMLRDELSRVNSKCVELEEQKCRLESELELTKVNLTTQIEALEEHKKLIKERMSVSEREQSEERKQLTGQIDKGKQELNEFRAQLERLKSDHDQSKEQLSAREEQIAKIDGELTTSRAELERLRADLQGSNKSQEKKDAEVQRLKSETQRLLDKIEQNQSEKLQLENELDNLKSRLEDKEGELASFNKKKLQFQSEMQALMKELSSEKEKNRELLMNSNQMNETQKDQLTEAYKELDSIRREHQKVSAQLDEQIAMVGRMQSKYGELEAKAKQLEQSNQELCAQIERRDRQKQEELNSLRDEHSREMAKIESKLVGHEGNLKKLHDGLVEKDLEINGLQLEHQRRVEQLSAESQSRCGELERQVDELRRELERKQNETAAELAKLKAEEAKRLASQQEQLNDEDDKELYESQIRFLNSVIVDMQAQNDELKSKVKCLEEIRMEEMNMFKATGDHGDDQFSFRPVSGDQQLYLASAGQRTTRLFCDYCDKFDLHDSEDCPTNSRLKQEQAEHTRLNQPKKNSRAYCVNCELFSHWTIDCPLEKAKGLNG